MPISRQCKAKKKNGQRCTAYAVKRSDYCLTHSPSRARERAARNRRGGLARLIRKVSGGAVEIADAQSVLQLINKVVLDTWEQENSAPRSRALLAAGDLAIKAMQIGELEQRVKALEQRMEGKQ